MDIENYVISNIKNLNYSELLDEIKNAKEEEALPGLGVIFKIYFNSLDENKKSQLAKDIISLL